MRKQSCQSERKAENRKRSREIIFSWVAGVCPPALATHTVNRRLMRNTARKMPSVVLYVSYTGTPFSILNSLVSFAFIVHFSILPIFFLFFFTDRIIAFQIPTLLMQFWQAPKQGERKTRSILLEVSLPCSKMNAQLNAHRVKEMKEGKKDEVIFLYKAVPRVH